MRWRHNRSERTGIAFVSVLIMRQNRKDFDTAMKKTAIKRSLLFVDNIFATDFSERFHYHSIGFHDPSYEFDDDKIAFIHVPKTGGTSLHTVLSKDKLSRFVGLKMHRPISLACPPGKYKYITVMRNPVERVWSFYNMVVSRGPNYPYYRFSQKGLEYFVRHCWEARNIACRYYSGEIFKEPNERTANEALKNLGKFAHVLDLGDFANEFIHLLQCYGIETAKIPHERKANNRSCNQQEFSIISKYNKLDCELYHRWIERQATSF